MNSTRRIEELWQSLRTAGGPGQQRIDAAHAHDIYADFEPPHRLGIVVVCPTRPSEVKPMRSLLVSVGQRKDRRWSFRLSLQEPTLQPVFAALCEDVISATEAGVSEGNLAAAVVRRVQHWRALLEKDSLGLGDATLQGLIGELVVLEREIMRRLPPATAIGCWRGPFGAAQDFHLPSGERVEVKAVSVSATSVQVNGLGQLDAAGDPLTLAVVRVQSTAASAKGALTAPALIGRLRQSLEADVDVRRAFDAALAAFRWHDHPSHDEFAVRVLGIDAYVVDDQFPKLTVGTVAAGILDANYTAVLPAGHRDWWGDQA